MPFKLPSRRLQWGITAAAPRNYGRANQYMSAQAELDHTVSRANAQYLEAIAVDGIEINYWHRGTEGRFCTCHDPSSAQSTLQADGLDANGNSNNPDGSASGGTDVIFTIRGSLESRVQRPNASRDVFGARLGDLPTSEEQSDKILQWAAGEETDEEMERAGNADALQRMNPEAAILFGAENIRCGICFRTGHVNGYSLHNGRRDVLDATGAFDYTTTSFVVDRKARPNVFFAAHDLTAYVQFDYEVPTYFERCLLVAVRNNVDESYSCKVQARLKGTADPFLDLTTDTIEALRGDGAVLQVRVSPKQASHEGMSRFTHVEIVYQFAPWPKAQMPNRSEATNFALFDTALSSEMTLPPTIVQASKEDVIWESKYGRLWKVTDLTDFMTAARQVCGWTASVRGIQEYEQLALLRLIRDRHFALSYGRLESIQGARIASASEF
jgi:hypothetical protein